MRSLLEEIMNSGLEQIVLSNTRDAAQALRVRFRPVLLKEELVFQESLYRGKQVFHTNHSREEVMARIEELMSDLMRQGEFHGASADATLLVSKKGKQTLKIKRRQAAAPVKTAEELTHNRSKKYILQDGEVIDFLVGLGVQTPDGKIKKDKYDKFRQINRYLEFIEDVLKELPKEGTVRIIDFGCGKSYLTFAMYYYLHDLQHRDIVVTGLDLKEDVIRHCNALAKELGFDKLTFEVGDISAYEGTDKVDMVVTLHACDTATDYALQKAVNWGASVILAVPCCQHELNRQIKNETLQPILKYGLIKERMSALITDALRANLLEQQGYRTQILEFIDMEHTPKNLLIRAVRQNGMRPKSQSGDLAGLEEFLQVNPTLEKLFKE